MSLFDAGLLDALERSRAGASASAARPTRSRLTSVAVSAFWYLMTVGQVVVLQRDRHVARDLLEVALVEEARRAAAAADDHDRHDREQQRERAGRPRLPSVRRAGSACFTSAPAAPDRAPRTARTQPGVPLAGEPQAPLALEERQRAAVPILDQPRVRGQLRAADRGGVAGDAPRQRVRRATRARSSRCIRTPGGTSRPRTAARRPQPRIGSVRVSP